MRPRMLRSERRAPQFSLTSSKRDAAVDSRDLPIREVRVLRLVADPTQNSRVNHSLGEGVVEQDRRLEDALTVPLEKQMVRVLVLVIRGVH